MTEPSGHQTTSFREVYRRGGPFYASMFTARWLVHQVVELLDRRLISVEQRRGIVEPWAILARRLTAADNKRLWNTHDWSSLGEEWTRSDEWKAEVIRKYLDPHFKAGTDIVEIGPGGGRWTEFLLRKAKRLVLIDVAEKPLELCRERFRNESTIEYLVSDGRSLPVGSASIDAIWSFDVFVHINPLDIKQYFHEFARVLRPGGTALIHHAGAPDRWEVYRPGMRSDMTDAMALEFAKSAGLLVDFQTTDPLIKPRDVISMLRKPA